MPMQKSDTCPCSTASRTIISGQSAEEAGKMKEGSEKFQVKSILKDIDFFLPVSA